jgi:DNA-binding MarR family transcriptional regulator
MRCAFCVARRRGDLQRDRGTHDQRDPDITRLLDRLERRGLVVRSREGRDRRVIITRISQAGLELLRGLDRPIEEFNRKQMGHLSEQQLRALVKLLEAIREKAE